MAETRRPAQSDKNPRLAPSLRAAFWPSVNSESFGAPPAYIAFNAAAGIGMQAVSFFPTHLFRHHYPRPVAHSLQSGVMRRRSALHNWLEYVPALAALKALELAPLPVAHRLARAYTRVLDLAIPRLRRTAEYNLAMAMPDQDPRSIIDGVFG